MREAHFCSIIFNLNLFTGYVILKQRKRTIAHKGLTNNENRNSILATGQSIQGWFFYARF